MDVAAARGRQDLAAIRILALVALVIGLVSCSASAKPHAKATAPERTAIRTFSAYDSAGQLIARVHDVETGSCWTSSIAAPVRDAYRCYAGDDILDPCFAPPGNTSPDSVACIDAPWSDALVLHLSDPLPDAAPLGDGTRPWALQLANGARCVAATGTIPSVDGVDLTYRCTDGRSAGMVGTDSPTVRAEYGDPKAETLQAVTVTTIWRG